MDVEVVVVVVEVVWVTRRGRQKIISLPWS
jgi:hypothetical protein